MLPPFCLFVGSGPSAQNLKYNLYDTFTPREDVTYIYFSRRHISLSPERYIHLFFLKLVCVCVVFGTFGLSLHGCNLGISQECWAGVLYSKGRLLYPERIMLVLSILGKVPR